mgnify:CR=1 FL=1
MLPGAIVFAVESANGWTHFFVQLGVDEAIAAEDACKAEHILSEQTLEKIREYALLHDAQDSVKPQGE